jgi:hypothetical protein
MRLLILLQSDCFPDALFTWRLELLETARFELLETARLELLETARLELSGFFFKSCKHLNRLKLARVYTVCVCVCELVCQNRNVDENDLT